MDPDGRDDYIFYNFDDFHNQASREYEKLVAERGGDENKVHLISCRTSEQFAKDWSNMVDPDTVVLIFHGNETGITLNYDGPESERNGFLTCNSSGFTKNGNYALRITDLEKKTITQLKLYSCQSGNVNESSNLAISFMNSMTIGSVIASDGNLSFTDNWDPRISNEGYQEYKEKYKNNPQGLVEYTWNKKGELVSREIINVNDIIIDIIN